MAQGLESRRMIGKLGLGLVGVVGLTYAATSYFVRPAPINIQNLADGGVAEQRAIVQVSGAIKKPGVYDLTTDKRVMDAIAQAGGTVVGADLSKINQAAKLVDGTVLNIPAADDVDNSACYAEYLVGGVPHAAASFQAKGSSKGGKSSKKNSPAPGSISINNATAEELDQLPGIGPSTAQKIIAYRQQHGQFKSIDELLAVKGIGPKKLEAMRPFLKL